VAASLWQQFAAHGGTPVGHRARETAMLELRQPIVHREVVEGDSVVSAGLNWLVDPVKESFAGSDALAGGPAARPIGFLVEAGRAAVGDLLYVGPEEVGRIVYLVTSPGAGGDLGLARVAPEWQASRLEFTTPSGARLRTLAPPYVVPRSWTTPIEV
jgi:aminomethyltransferase